MSMQARRSRKAAAAAPAPPATALPRDVASLISRAAALSAPIFAARRQTIAAGPTVADVFVDRKPCRMVALFACALQEMSAFTIRNGVVTSMVLRHAVILRGENPIIMPDHALSIDWVMLGRSRALGVKPELSWDQGRGPLLTLLLPSERPIGAMLPDAGGLAHALNG
jgi:hypothetical protein